MGVCGVVLSAGRGPGWRPSPTLGRKRRSRSDRRNLLDRAVDVLRPFVDEIALNVSGHTDWFAAHVPSGVRVFEEGPEPLGTAGGLYNMQEWIGGRDVVVLNADSVLFGDVADFVGGRDQAPTRLLVTLDRASPDFDGLWRFVGLSTMDQATLALIGPDTEDLYRDLWKRQLADGGASPRTVHRSGNRRRDAGQPVGRESRRDRRQHRRRARGDGRRDCRAVSRAGRRRGTGGHAPAALRRRWQRTVRPAEQLDRPDGATLTQRCNLARDCPIHSGGTAAPRRARLHRPTRAWGSSRRGGERSRVIHHRGRRSPTCRLQLAQTGSRGDDRPGLLRGSSELA